MKNNQGGFREAARLAQGEREASAAIEAAIAASLEKRLAIGDRQHTRARLARRAVVGATWLLTSSVLVAWLMESHIAALVALVALIFLIFTGLWRLMTLIEPDEGNDELPDYD